MAGIHLVIKRGISMKIGDRFGRLLVLEPRQAGCINKRKWLCKCDCGSIKVIRERMMKRGQVRSCGCLRKEMMTVHGKSRTTLYRRWQSMLDRCNNKACKLYHRYGGRGITVCERWKSNFDNFLADMGAPSPGMELDRINNDGNYEPNNCRWATKKENNRNKEYHRYVETPSGRMTAAEAAERFGLTAVTMAARSIRGLTGAELVAPAPDPSTITWNGKTLSILGWSKQLGISKYVIRGRIKHGWTAEEALTTPVRRRRRPGQVVHSSSNEAAA